MCALMVLPQCEMSTDGRSAAGAKHAPSSYLVRVRARGRTRVRGRGKGRGRGRVSRPLTLTVLRTAATRTSS